MNANECGFRTQSSIDRVTATLKSCQRNGRTPIGCWRVSSRGDDAVPVIPVVPPTTSVFVPKFQISRNTAQLIRPLRFYFHSHPAEHVHCLVAWRQEFKDSREAKQPNKESDRKYSTDTDRISRKENVLNFDSPVQSSPRMSCKRYDFCLNHSIFTLHGVSKTRTFACTRVRVSSCS